MGLAGFGYWGTKLARNVADAPACELAAVCDASDERRDAAAAQYGARTFDAFDAMLADGDVDAVLLATPAGDHHAQARAALFAGKHVMVEKPLAMSTEHCDELERLAAERGLVLMTGHTFLYSAPVRLLKQLIDEGELGEVLYCYSQRLNLGAIRSDTSAMWDLAPHDISIFLHLLGGTPTMVSAQQFSLIEDRQEDIGMVTMVFPGGTVGHVHVSRLDPRKVRELTIVGSRKKAVYDDTNPEMPVRIYDKGVDRRDEDPLEAIIHADFARHNLELRSGDVVAPHVVGREPLRLEVEDFAASIREGRVPVSSGRVGRDVVAVLEAADRSSVLGGEPMAPAQPEEDADARAAA
jgi:predicted dehydrogenase